MLRRPLTTVLLVLALAALAAPALAPAQSPFAPLPTPQSSDTQTATTATTNGVDDGGLDRWQEILIFIGGVALVIGIGWAILHDARSVAPVADTRELYGEAERKPGTRPPADQRKRQSRKKGKAQRAARKHNR